MVGIAQLVSAPDCGSGGPGFKSLYPPFAFADNSQYAMVYVNAEGQVNGLSPSGKAQDFDSCIHQFESG